MQCSSCLLTLVSLAPAYPAMPHSAVLFVAAVATVLLSTLVSQPPASCAMMLLCSPLPWLSLALLSTLVSQPSASCAILHLCSCLSAAHFYEPCFPAAVEASTSHMQCSCFPLTLVSLAPAYPAMPHSAVLFVAA